MPIIVWARGVTAETLTDGLGVSAQISSSQKFDGISQQRATEAINKEIIRIRETWRLTLSDMDTEPGEIISIELPAGGFYRTVFGSGIYGGNSSIGSAAVHAGLISYESGGKVTLVVRRSPVYFMGGKSNGVQSNVGDRQESAFAFIQDDRLVEVPIEIRWSMSATGMPVGTKITATLPPGGKNLFVFGSGPYDMDSAIGAAAVHAGIIDFENGGEVSLEVLPRKPFEIGTEANGVISLNAGDGKTSYRFIDKK